MKVLICVVADRCGWQALGYSDWSKHDVLTELVDNDEESQRVYWVEAEIPDAVEPVHGEVVTQP